MPSKSPSDHPAEKLRVLGEQIRTYRKGLRISATAAAEAAGMSRVTWHRIENGEPSVTIGAFLSALEALSLDFGILAETLGSDSSDAQGRPGWIPARVRIADYPQLKQLAWHVQGTDELTPAEALGVYERNWRHLDLANMRRDERELVDALRIALGPARDV